MNDARQIAESYLAAFNETDPQRRRELLEQLYTADSTYTDPHVDLKGQVQMDEFISATQARFEGFTFALAGDVDAHHEQARFRWHAGPPQAPDRYVGFDVVVTDGGRIRNVYGFMDAAPAD